ncbi:tyrosine-type recombinase/integrase [Mesorhizobium sp. M7A.F.Ca.US.006.01.1.1]|uniref:tyrosine-type recombinase/integrase n=1 Tax=Mesorhizobium sp. M7A.F.Ca.US.006.01.1.1 TaxID=2496707 RepID=UPI0013E3BCBE|nr:tyrosine-type recombinase/integrase [Mesorhizobium sp. M7A.F.Ca.US.006.01.1.1]
MVSFSLGTNDKLLAKVRTSIAVTQLERAYEALRVGPTTLSQRQIIALSGEIYRLFVESFQENPGTPKDWASFKALNRAAREGRLENLPSIGFSFPQENDAAMSFFGQDLTEGVDSLPPSANSIALERRFGGLVSWVLGLHTILVDTASRHKLLVAVDQAVTDAAYALKRNADGDYSPDPKADRFPAFVQTGVVFFQALFDKWASERSPAASTQTTWRTAIKSLQNHVGHEDARRISETDVVSWKDGLVATGLSAKTINGSYLAALNVLYVFAIANKLLSENPAIGIRAATANKAGTRMLPYSTEEVGRLLSIAEHKGTPRRRWLIWLAATSGARIGEIAQLWGSSIVREDGIDVMRIMPAPDGGSLKNEGSERTVPIHSAVVAAGFLQFVKQQGNGPLFYRRSSGEPTKTHASKGVTNHLASWIREEGFVDPRKAPNHALRHWWKSQAVDADVQDSLADHIQGHATKSAAGGYRHFSIETVAKAVEKIPLPKPTRNVITSG